MTDDTRRCRAGTDSGERCERCEGRGWNLRDRRIQPCDCGTYAPPTWVRRGDRPCILTHHNDPDRPRRAAHGWLCGGHYARFEQSVAELPALYDDLGEVLTASEKRDAEQGNAKNGAKTAGLSLNEAVVEARRELHNECVRMVLEVTEARNGNVMAPTVDTVAALATWLTTQTDWMADQDDADDTYRYLNTLVTSGRKLVFPSGRRKFTVGTCETPVACDVTTHTVSRCQGSMEAILTPSETLELPSVIRCDTCALEVPATGWYRWGQGRTA